MSEINVENCIHCGLCTRNCSFLKKYDLDLQKFSEHPELAYSCFMCRKCSQVCPKKISGEKIALAMRKEQVQKRIWHIEGFYGKRTDISLPIIKRAKRSLFLCLAAIFLPFFQRQRNVWRKL